MAIVTRAEVLQWLGKSDCATAAESALVDMLIPLGESVLKGYVGSQIEQATYTHFLPESDDILDPEPDRLDVSNNRVVFDVQGATDVLVLPQRPVRSITSVNEDIAAYGGQGASDFSGSNLTSGTDYYIDYTASGISWSGNLMRIAGPWSGKRRTVKVVYVAGFTAAEITAGTILGPDERTSIRNLKYAALITVASAFLEAQRNAPGLGAGPVIMERLADYQVQYAERYIQHLSMTTDLPHKAKELVSTFRRLSV